MIEFNFERRRTNTIAIRLSDDSVDNILAIAEYHGSTASKVASELAEVGLQVYLKEKAEREKTKPKDESKYV